MKIADYLKTSFIDYKDHVASVVFTSKCNFSCPFCHNKNILKTDDLISEKTVLKHLEKRRNILDGIVISGGEPTLQVGLTSFLQDVKSLGYDVKLDTNGYRPQVVQRLIQMSLIDYVAMDIKNTSSAYADTIGRDLELSKVYKTMEIIKNTPIEYEFRTTMIKDFHADIESLFEMVSDAKRFVMQQYRYSESQIVDCKYDYFTLEEMYAFKKRYKSVYNIGEVIVKGSY
ncbi:anaerobic ribonucleoside-triphosphate reductase activating protein [Acidaminobacter sp. JC074]|uniref:anaerobic ribonucleoside-triphosphate reductase activating protein n=1 Tax=Acidaminobacter sp. JC074 TaxID=2530199 RepID=UPI001F10EA56|nr:anaerobic ribonucleoside-triphosphate reductase activating protein [Acidaminobacter sp. JC074]MCH4889192.1 anaerobic ribonucleoside-triphosphate reductase activating protein [Acidaminobacter sp. JC074]